MRTWKEAETTLDFLPIRLEPWGRIYLNVGDSTETSFDAGKLLDFLLANSTEGEQPLGENLAKPIIRALSKLEERVEALENNQ